MSATPAILAASAGVGFGHAILPDHWVPLAVVGRTRHYPLARVARLSGLAGVAHVLVSVLLGALIIAIGLQFRSTVEHAQNAIVGAVLLATGLAFLALELSGRGHTHDHDHDHDHDRAHAPHSYSGERRRNPSVRAQKSGRLRGFASIMVPFGAAASPDLTILPIFLAAAAAGAGTAVGSLVAFAVTTIATIMGLTLLATAGGYQLGGERLDRWGNTITAATLITIGVLVITGTI
jgi:hypothetical protein